MKSITIAHLVDSLIIENIKLFNLREKISSASDENVVELWEKIDKLNNNRRLLKEDLDTLISKYEIKEEFSFVKTEGEKNFTTLVEDATNTWLDIMKVWLPSKDTTLAEAIRVKCIKECERLNKVRMKILGKINGSSS